MSVIDLARVTAIIDKLKEIEKKLSKNMGQFDELRGQIGRHSYTESEQKMLIRQREALEEECISFRQMIRALQVISETYRDCEQQVIEVYEQRSRQYPEPEIRLNNIQFFEDIREIASIWVEPRTN